MVPYSSGLKGTSLHMAKEKNKLLSLVGSPLLKIDGTSRWFITMAQADVYEPRLYEICLDDNSGQENHNWCWSERQKIAKQLTKEEREKILKRHPALTARMFDLKQSCIWDCIINGKHQPLGKIIDTWRRIEFQLRGTPHSHGMACVIHDGILAEFFDEADEEQISKIAKIVDNTVTACLVERPINCNKDLEFLDTEQQEISSSAELDYYWTPPFDNRHAMNNYFQDYNDPRRESFNPDLDYSRVDVFSSSETQSIYRRLQLVNQMHRCCFTCFKYADKNELGEKVCRSMFPFQMGVASNKK